MFSLPPDVLVYILSKWIELPSVAQIDSAACNSRIRDSSYIAVLRSFGCFLTLNVNDKRVISSAAWLNLRGFRMFRLVVDFLKLKMELLFKIKCILLK